MPSELCLALKYSHMTKYICVEPKYYLFSTIVLFLPKKPLAITVLGTISGLKHITVSLFCGSVTFWYGSGDPYH
jgi:hypothetical protein